jgi:hypothetical protein
MPGASCCPVVGVLRISTFIAWSNAASKRVARETPGEPYYCDE